MINDGNLRWFGFGSADTSQHRWRSEAKGSQCSPRWRNNKDNPHYPVWQPKRWNISAKQQMENAPSASLILFPPTSPPLFPKPSHTPAHTNTHSPVPPSWSSPPHKSILPSGSEEHAEIERGQANKAGWKDAENKSILVWRRRTLKGLKIAGLTKAWINKNECASGFIIYFPQEEAPLLSHTHTLRDSLVARLQHLWLPSTGLKVLFTSAACVQPPSFYPSFEI